MKYYLLRYKGIYQSFIDKAKEQERFLPAITWNMKGETVSLNQKGVKITLPFTDTSARTVHWAYYQALAKESNVTNQYMFDCYAVVPTKDKALLADSDITRYPIYCYVDSALVEDNRKHYLWLLKLNPKTMQFENTGRTVFEDERMYQGISPSERWHSLLLGKEIKYEDEVEVWRYEHFITREK